MALVLLVEDDQAIAKPLVRAIEREGFVVRHVNLGHDALDTVRAGPVDLVILDLTLPDMDGLDVCHSIRATQARLPIVILTARRDEADIVIGLDAGADDYIGKPFRLAELLARVRARLRVAPIACLEVQDVRIDQSAHRAWKANEQLDLTPKEFALLALLAREAGQIVRRSRIMAKLWDTHYYGSGRTLDMHISSLRHKLNDDPANPTLITTVRGVGFRFETE